MGVQTSKRSVATVMVALLAACIAFQLNATMLSPALASIGHELETDQSVIGLTQTAFFTAAALFSLFLPRLSDIVGRRKILVGMMVLLAIGSVISALAPDVSWLFVGRIIQGVSGPTVPLCLIMLRSEVTDVKSYGVLLGVITAVNGGVAGVDAFVGGFMVEHFGFRSIFWLMLVLAILAAFLVFALAPESRPAKGTAMDWRGVFFLVVAVGALLTALNEAAKLSSAFDSGTLLFALFLLAVAVVGFIGFWLTEKRSKHPMVEIKHLRQRATWAPLLTTTLTMTGIFAIINGVVPAYVQADHLGFDLEPTQMSLLILTPFALLGWFVGPFSGRLAPIIGYTKMLQFGLIGSLLSLAVIGFFGLNSLPLMVIGTALLGITYAGCVNIMLNGLGVLLSPPGNPGFLPGMNSGAFNLGAGLSFLIMPTLLVSLTPVGGGAAYFIVVLIGIVITAAALATSFLIPQPTTAEVSA